jgi:hypothetical protein
MSTLARITCVTIAVLPFFICFVLGDFVAEAFLTYFMYVPLFVGLWFTSGITYVLETVAIGKTQNTHSFKIMGKLPVSWKGIYPVPNLLNWFYRRKHFIKFVDASDSDRTKHQTLEITAEPKISSEVLYIAEHSGNLSNAMKDLFTSKMPSKRIFFLIGTGAVIAIAVYFLTGGFKF